MTYAPEKVSEILSDLQNRPYQGGEIINAATDPLKANRYLVTLIHRYTGEERLIDLLIDGQGFTAVIQEIRRHVSPVFEFFEWLDCDEPF